MIKSSRQAKLNYFFKTLHAREAFGRTITKSTLTKIPEKSHHQEFIKLDITDQTIVSDQAG